MFYDLAIGIYDLLVHLAAPFSRKPRKMMKGHWVVYELLRQQLEKDVRYIWFHAASLGEFEQGRPLIEKIRAKYPDYGILLTFFSPSGYEVRKNYRGADVVCYLPFDKPRNVKKFLDIANPCMAFFIKYEFWYIACRLYSVADRFSLSGTEGLIATYYVISIICLCRMNVLNAIWVRSVSIA